MGSISFSPRILVVDDEVEITDMVARHFRLLGYDVSTENDPRNVVPRLATENFLVVITDIVMPQLSGTDLLKQIKQFNGLIQVIMLSGYVRLEYAMDCMRRGALTLLFKPLEDLTDLEEAVEEAISHLRRWEDILERLQGKGSALKS